MERDMTGTIYRSRDGSPETDRFPVMSRPMCYSFRNTNHHSRYATGKSDSHHFPWLGVLQLKQTAVQQLCTVTVVMQ